MDPNNSAFSSAVEIEAEVLLGDFDGDRPKPQGLFQMAGLPVVDVPDLTMPPDLVMIENEVQTSYATMLIDQKLIFPAEIPVKEFRHTVVILRWFSPSGHAFSRRILLSKPTREIFWGREYVA